MINVMQAITVIKSNLRLLLLLLISIFIGLVSFIWDSTISSCAIIFIQHLLIPVLSVRIFLGKRTLSLESRLISGVFVGGIMGLLSAISLILIESMRSPIFATREVADEFNLLIYISYLIFFTCSSIFFGVVAAITLKPKES